MALFTRQHEDVEQAALDRIAVSKWLFEVVGRVERHGVHRLPRGGRPSGALPVTGEGTAVAKEAAALDEAEDVVDIDSMLAAFVTDAAPPFDMEPALHEAPPLVADTDEWSDAIQIEVRPRPRGVYYGDVVSSATVEPPAVIEPAAVIEPVLDIEPVTPVADRSEEPAADADARVHTLHELAEAYEPRIEALRDEVRRAGNPRAESEAKRRLRVLKAEYQFAKIRARRGQPSGPAIA